MYIIAGLGNPTSKYEKTRHNVGFDTIDYIADKYGIKVDIAKHKSLCGMGIIGGEKVLLMKPQTFMNLSGEAIQAACSYYKADIKKDLIVIYDDISLAVGNLRVRRKGSAGGHNGIKSIIAMLGSEDFARIKIGVGEKPVGWDLADYVLSHFDKSERKLLDDTIAKAVEGIDIIVENSIDKCMNELN